MKAVIGIILVIIIGVLIFGTRDRDADTTTGQSDLDRFASISLTDYGGGKVSLGDFRDKPLVINSWAVWCPFCRNELADFVALQEEFGEEITVIAIDRQEPRDKANGFTDEIGVTDKMLFLLDPEDSFYQSLGGFSMPETIFVDVSGNIVFHKRGPLTLEEMRASVERYLR